MQGIFITIEGPDGAGKTSVLREIMPRLQFAANREFVVTREPGGSEIAEQIREIILDVNNTAMDERTEALLYAAARRQHLIEKVIPALKRGAIVIADRYVDSSVAYQGAGRKLGMDAVYDLNQFATEGLEPDFTLYLDVDSEVGLERIRFNRANEINRLDMDEISFHQRVRHGYLKLLQNFPNRIHRIDARHHLTQVADESFGAIIDRFPEIFNRI
ncbi:MAG: dTMP kinase [Streptococcaceae bacterium]|jgi:dTMP kinase|nr:dTMP kinase [Streptococcaceae bacterium]